MRYILSLFLLISIGGYSQCKTYIIGVNRDTLNCTDFNGKKQGRWVSRREELRGEPGYEEQGVYINDKKEGQWQVFSLSGDLQAIENYRWGNKNGRSFYFTRFGQPLREESWKAVNPENPYDTVDVYDLVDPTKVIDRAVVKLDGFTLKHGLWKYFDPETGAIEKTEHYRLDSLRTGFDDLAPIDISSNSKSDTATKKAPPKPQAILEYEKKNSGKKKIKVRDGRTGG
jgi:antitoxin component YwqK of YwqJK toxin-antitoxin module